MSEKEKKKLTNKKRNKIIIIFAIILVAMTSTLLIYNLDVLKEKNIKSMNEVEKEQKVEYTDNIAEIQSKIDEQQNIINEMNEQLNLLKKQKKELEEQMLDLTNSGNKTDEVEIIEDTEGIEGDISKEGDYKSDDFVPEENN